MILESIYTYWKSVSEITDLVGTDPCKIFFGHVPTELKKANGRRVDLKPPWILVTDLGGDSELHLSGDTGVATDDFAVEFSSTSLLKAKTLFDETRQKINTFNHGLWGSTFVQSCFMSQPRDVTPQPVTGADVDWPTVLVSMTITYNRTAASPA
jgi:hypothetical protein